VFGWAFTGRLKRYKGIATTTVARAMIELLNREPSRVIWESDALAEF